MSDITLASTLSFVHFAWCLPVVVDCTLPELEALLAADADAARKQREAVAAEEVARREAASAEREERERLARQRSEEKRTERALREKEKADRRWAVALGQTCHARQLLCG